MRPTVSLTADILTTDYLQIRPWPDPVIDSLGFDPRSAYVESYWLGHLGPSTTWLLRRMVAGLDEAPAGYQLSMSDTARSLGLSDRGGRHSPFVRAVARTIQFELALPGDGAVLAVRRKLPPLSQHQVERLPVALQRSHARWQEQQLHVPSGDRQRRQGRLLALSMFELGEDLEAAERQLLRWRYHPALARDAATWAWERHRAALASAG
jgi:hypothetical protein